MCCCWPIAKCQELIDLFLRPGGPCSCQLLSLHLSFPLCSCVSSYLISSLLLPFSPLLSSSLSSNLLLSVPLCSFNLLSHPFSSSPLLLSYPLPLLFLLLWYDTVAVARFWVQPWLLIVPVSRCPWTRTTCPQLICLSGWYCRRCVSVCMNEWIWATNVKRFEWPQFTIELWNYATLP